MDDVSIITGYSYPNVLFCTKHNVTYANGSTCPDCDGGSNPIATFKKDAGKLRWSLLPTDALEQVVKVLEFGAVKYGPNQWRELPEFEWMRISDALERHHTKWKRGKDIDDESGLLELAHLACNALFLLEMEIHKLGKDNRFKYKP